MPPSEEKNCLRSMGRPGVRVEETLNGICPDLARYIVEYSFREIYAREILDNQTKEQAVVAALTAMGTAAPQLAARGIDAIEVTGGTGGAVPGLKETGFDESVFRIYAETITAETTAPVILVGVNRTPAVMDHLLNTTGIRYFSLSRPLIRQPDLVNLWKSTPGSAAACTSCNQCRQPGGNPCPFD